MKRWETGRAEIEELIGQGRLERVTPSREQADHLLTQAQQHLRSASVVAADDPEGGYALVYDAARKALAAVLENQGLRTTSMRGHHLTLFDAVLAHSIRRAGPQLRPFKRMQRRRNAAVYPSRDEPAITAADVEEDATKAAVIVDRCARVLDHMPVF